MKRLFSWIAGIIIGIAIGLAIPPLIKTAAKYFGSPQVTLINASGVTVSSATISLTNAEQSIQNLKDGHSATVHIRGEFCECSIHVKWTDPTGDYEADAGGYMENYGMYHSTVILMPDKKVKLVCETQESN
jgi:hypothetical protein